MELSDYGSAGQTNQPMKNHQPKKSKWSGNHNTWLMAAAIAGGFAAVSSVQGQNLLLNSSFEEAVTAKITKGYNGAEGQVDAPSWFTPGATAPADTGIENPGLANMDGSWTAYLQGGNPGTAGYLAQTTGYVIQSGDAFDINLLGAPRATFTAGWGAADATLHYSLYYGGDATTMGTVFGDGYIDLGTGNSNPFSTFSVSGIAAPGGAAGQVLGIAFYNSSGVDPFVGDQAAPSQSWIAIDSVSLSVSAVPEPASIALLGLGSLGMLALRRRRA